MPFQKGISGNTGGRPKEDNEVKKLAKQYTKQAIKKLAEWMESDNPKASVAACTALLNRGWGMPRQEVELSTEDDKSFVVNVNIREKKK